MVSEQGIICTTLCHIWHIDLFASRTNHQLPRYMTVYPDPNAVAVNAFFHVWNEYVYIFPHFNLIFRVLKKFLEDGTGKALVGVPQWKTQSWIPKMIKMSVGETVHLKPSKTLLYPSPRTWRQFTLSPPSFT